MPRLIGIAPDSFKGSLSSPDVCRMVIAAWNHLIPEDQLVAFPLADGGEGTVEALVNATGGEQRTCRVLDPLGRPVEAVWGMLGDETTAVIEMASASGLYRLDPNERNPLFTSTFGTGQLIVDALNNGCRRVIIGIGGSATNDGGAGMAEALGAVLLGREGNPLSPGGRYLSGLHKISLENMHPGIPQTEFIAACDVDNPLCGPEGASAVYGPQKGASPEMVDELDRALRHYAAILKRDLKADVLDVPGAGAAGGLGAGLMAFLNARLRPGVELVMEHSGFREWLEKESVDLVITGEGEINSQTVRGKVPVGVSRLALKRHIPVIALVGSLGENYQAVYQHGISAVVNIIPRPMTLEEAMSRAEELVFDAAHELARLCRVFGP